MSDSPRPDPAPLSPYVLDPRAAGLEDDGDAARSRPAETADGLSEPGVRTRDDAAVEDGTSAWASADLAGTEPTTVEAAPPEPETRTASEHLALLLPRLVDRVEGSRLWGWIAALAVTAVAAVLRLVALDRPARVVFDETYYVKQAYSLLTLGYEGDWADEQDEAFAAGDYSGLSETPDYVVHPPLGKWLIAIGMRLLGTESMVGWRISGAVAGIIGVLLVVRIGRRLLGSTLLGATAGLLLAVDGMHIVMSRTGILDIFVSTFVIAAFGTLLLDREQSRRRLATRVAGQLAEHGRLRDPWGPRIGVRWWLVATGVLLGLACGVKWSGIYAVAVFGILAVVWSVFARRAAGVRLWVGAGLVRDGVSSFVALVPTAVLTYVAGWASWFASDGAYNRRWAQDVNAVAAVPERTWMPDALNSLWQYHLQMWSFHQGLDSEHTYSSHPVGWLLQVRPTSFAWKRLTDAQGNETGDVEVVLALGNPIVWWGGAIALLVVLWWALRRRDWRAWGILAGYAAMYLPWFTYSAPFANRTIFTFYTVAFAPFVALALAYALGKALAPDGAGTRARRRGYWILGGVVGLAVVVAAFYWPIWIGHPVPYEFWRWHMWIPSFSSLRVGWV
ncbi:phospholipid carrier-dependent glycosyltransferase [Serinibacter arcticus]|uniref:Polyprenol-phosphate-mannose--protein mannosyltransferase n=1 Tax=Serinibacter arcticus TaxID=1655435 RepID=A0A2U1ZY92_9MICO|nr:phospholipid carrier-dependent glycosyltransferase [Serinibacter arcticus]PWD51957.1 phospholipid carrier-dependent glycosyltransferase [Serinibacter arcticus]